MTSLGIHWRELLIFILPPEFSFKNSTRVKTKVVFYQGGNLLRIQMSICHLFLCWTTCQGKKPLSSFSTVFQSSWWGFALRKTAGGNLYIEFLFILKLKCIFILRAWAHRVQGLHACVEVRGQFPGSVLSCFSESHELRLLVVGRHHHLPDQCASLLPAVCEQRSPLAVSREPRVLLGYTRLHALTHWEGRKVILKHPSKSLTFYDFRTFLEKNQRPGIFQPFELRLWGIKSHLRWCTHTDTWQLCSLIWWENIPLGNKCKVGGGKWLHT